VRAAYLAGVRRLADTLAALIPNINKARRREALATLATLIGAIILARATKGSPLSREILGSARNSLLPEKERALRGAKAACVPRLTLGKQNP
jgi:TetR/AcrR family transcriptional repressor of nem operon